MQPGLSLDQAPPLDVPVRFFLTAPLFGAGLGALLLVQGGELLVDRWLPASLAAAHLLTLGVLGMVMFGALFQMLPVVAGSPVAATGAVSRVVHLGLSLGTLALALGLAGDKPVAVRIALILLLAAGGLFVFAIGRALLRAPRPHPSVRGMRLALVGLILTLGLGGLLGLGHAGLEWPLWRHPLTDYHVAWATLGWVTLLLVSVAYQVVPMFQITPEYPPALTRWLGPVLFGSLLAWSLGRALGLAAVSWLAELLISLGLVAWASLTLSLQARRQRRLADATLDAWRISMLSLLAAVALFWAQRWLPVERPTAGSASLAVLVLAGFALSAVNGMLYKILPFLCWFHLQSASLRRGGARPSLPGMRSLLPTRRTRPQVALHAAALLCLLAATVWPILARPAGALLLAAQLGLGANLLGALRKYHAARRAVLETAD